MAHAGVAAHSSSSTLIDGPPSLVKEAHEEQPDNFEENTNKSEQEVFKFSACVLLNVVRVPQSWYLCRSQVVDEKVASKKS